MARYIDADTIVKDLKKNIEADSVAFSAEEKSLVNFGLELAIDIVNATPTADVAEVVRCRNCANFKEIITDKAGICYHRSSNGLRGITDFCSYGVKKGRS